MSERFTFGLSEPRPTEKNVGWVYLWSELLLQSLPVLQTKGLDWTPPRSNEWEGVVCTADEGKNQGFQVNSALVFL